MAVARPGSTGYDVCERHATEVYQDGTALESIASGEPWSLDGEPRTTSDRNRKDDAG